MKNSVLLILMILLTAGCSIFNKVSDTYYEDVRLPGTVEVKSNFYYDSEEMCSIDWLEYMFWTSRVYGGDSKEYLNTVLDTSVWEGLNECFHELADRYHSSPQYRYLPIVGVSQSQAEGYSKWRSDRVFEQYLINHKKIKVDPSPTPETHFTIERYYARVLSTYISDDTLMFYPSFRLPTISEARFTANHVDSMNNYYLEKCKTKSCVQKQFRYLHITCDVDTCSTSIYFNAPYTPTTSPHPKYTWKPLKGRIVNLRGNVREWTSEKNFATGGGWRDTRERIEESLVFETDSVNAWTGFRNVCEWKKWNN